MSADIHYIRNKQWSLHLKYCSACTSDVHLPARVAVYYLEETMPLIKHEELCSIKMEYKLIFTIISLIIDVINNILFTFENLIE